MVFCLVWLILGSIALSIFYPKYLNQHGTLSIQEHLQTMKTVPLGNYTIEVHLDTANGIGALMLRYCTRLIGERVLEIQYHNDYQDGGELNANVGW